MRRAVLLLLAAFVLLAPPALADDRARAVASLEPAEGAVVGQKVVLSLKLASPTWFTGAPTLPEPDVANAIVKRFGSAGVNGSERVGTQTYTTQTWEWRIYPRRAGRYEVPALPVVIRVAGGDRKTVETEILTEPLTFEVVEPEGAGGRAYVLAAPSFEVRESLEPESGARRVGESIRREITLKVDDAPGMLIPPLAAADSPNASGYPETPVVHDEFDRGTLTGMRTEATTYVFTHAGVLSLPEVRITWWNTQTGTLEEAVVEGHDLEIVPNPDLDEAALATLRGEEPIGSTPRSSTDAILEVLPWMLLAIVLLAVAALLVMRRLPRWQAALERERTRRRESEGAAFGALRTACGTNDAAQAERALRTWLDRAYEPGFTVARFAAEAKDPALDAELERLDALRYGGAEGAWSGGRLAERAAAARRAWQRAAEAPSIEESLRLNPAR